VTPRARPLADRFWPKVRIGPDCWEWTGAIKDNGYGTITVGGRSLGHVYAHRASWEMAFGAIPAGMDICHRCDNRRCVRPDHLFVGTTSGQPRRHADEGPSERPGARVRRGDRNGRARLTWEQVREIRRRWAAGEQQIVLAREFGLGSTTVGHIVHGRHWRELPDGARAVRLRSS
jgi:hypothetical protein